MNCTFCGEKTKTKTTDLYLYKECGLPNVFLGDIKVVECGKCETKIPIIPSILDLHETIAEAIALKPIRLTGLEARFLRKQLGLNAAQWANYLRVDKSTVSRWENQQISIGEQSDSLIRYLYFRMLEEKDCKRIQKNISSKIANVESGCEEEFAFTISADNPSLYSFQRVIPLEKAVATC